MLIIIISSANKTALIFLVILVASLLAIIQSPSAETIPKPSAPQFTIQFVDKSYDVPPESTTTNPYTNETTTTTTPSYYVKNFTLEITIQNQPYPQTINGNQSSIYYNIRSKGHFADNWSELYQYSTTSAGSLLKQSDSNTTVISLPADYPTADWLTFKYKQFWGINTRTIFLRRPIPRNSHGRKSFRL